jgi:hypothetical protein
VAAVSMGDSTDNWLASRNSVPLCFLLEKKFGTMGVGDWGMGVGNWGMGVGNWGMGVGNWGMGVAAHWFIFDVDPSDIFACLFVKFHSLVLDFPMHHTIDLFHLLQPRGVVPGSVLDCFFRNK